MAVSAQILQCHTTYTLFRKRELIWVFHNFLSISVVFLISNNTAGTREANICYFTYNNWEKYITTGTIMKSETVKNKVRFNFPWKICGEIKKWLKHTCWISMWIHGTVGINPQPTGRLLPAVRKSPIIACSYCVVLS
jgi:hypothetical protein